MRGGVLRWVKYIDLADLFTILSIQPALLHKRHCEKGEGVEREQSEGVAASSGFRYCFVLCRSTRFGGAHKEETLQSAIFYATIPEMQYKNAAHQKSIKQKSYTMMDLPEDEHGE
ncbi:hypothetical protein CEXT_380881 [Caerostris extrusa]|uniref:Uncharacterized protein n=1 Tax=Caerostris extrusa TaxID=172846 RepID=A0AAV4VBE2_CAEEX|nr:hypothetical protein CEXT_380881 [Caerostris extrusa]